ncbi:hypothetical protein HMPREF0063_11923 [Aeromicrobium marinum DSM 15272]|uniref:Portal protein n=1 Tax=Aeromicrobium marinum DSM 15272 TaxID=585531 RepID=E2SDY7_9ACTN|nr:hypothetical protein [Aeromicrobium marinum]EFQ82714.1 hypothetical protein HMPREF0063_11923 [Aeromicrobium marinum DSM 15272]
MPDTAVLTETAPAQTLQYLSEQLDQASNQIEILEESLADIELAREDHGWKRIGFWGEMEFTREGLRNSAQLCRIMAIANPILKRGLSLRFAYIWGSGVQISARATGPTDENQAQQDVNGFLQGWLDDPETLRVLYGAQARERNERTLGTDGNLFVALFTNQVTGWVRPRLIPFDEIARVVTNPDDRLDRWFFLREWTQLVTEDGTAPGTTRVRRVTRRQLYPSIDYRPTSKPTTIQGIPVAWDSPIAELDVNGLDTWDFGIGDAFASLPWAKGYTDFLTDWARLMKALSRYAFKGSAPSRGAAQKAAAAQRSSQLDPTLPGPRRAGVNQSEAGATVHLGPGQDFTAIPKTGATIDAESGKPIAAMVAAGLDIPVTMLLTDPGITGTRATAETLDKPTELMANARRDVWSAFLRRICNYVIDSAAKAPSGPLKRKATTRDRFTGRETVILAGNTDRTIEIAWPDISETPLKDLVESIVSADSTRRVPPLVTLKLLLQALHVDDVDDILADVTDEQGNFIDPNLNAGQAMIDALRRGESVPPFDRPPAADAA